MKNNKADQFLMETGTKFRIVYIGYEPHFPGDSECRDVYLAIFTRNGKRFSVRFGQSISGTEKGEEPSAYDVLSCLTKNDHGTFADFCGEFGYDTDSRQAERTHKAVCKEWQKVSGFWTEAEIEKLQEIN